ncbi:PREDICTED: venom serine carboxypeptidase-like [Papilio polytes]|uniref:venom serine carboxypeptidase-like n=1 Tax=Papilio polytes TaxID=76194 RepID=UPI0006762B25|nr:PREDICTED: venom serine carboxypeptidase-like [Papilio polytes]
MKFVYTLAFILSIKITESVTPALILTPLIEGNRTEEARKLASVDPLLFLNVTSYSGFLTVNKRYNSNLFFWYFPVPDKPVDKTPWIIWLQGGPGATSLAGVFDEIGPFEYKKDLGLKKRDWTWCREYSMVFIDNPVGAGFSFTDSTEGYARNMTMYSTQLYLAVRQLVVLFPELQSSELYVAGESYAGHYIPAFAQTTLQEMTDQRKLYNLKGLIMGNPLLDREGVSNFTSVFYHWGLIDRQGVIAVASLQEQFTKAVQKGNSSAAVELRNQLLDKLQQIAFKPDTYNVLKSYQNLEDFAQYIALENVREALHVGTIRFTFSNASVHTYIVEDFLSTMSPIVTSVLDHCRVLIYCGQLDLTVPCAPAAAWRRQHWRWRGRELWLHAPRTPWWYNESHAGYIKSGGGFTEALIQGAGHLAPVDKPEQVQQLVSYFIRGLDLPMPPNYQVDPANTPEYTEPDQESVPETGTGFKTGLIVSISLNVLLAIGLLVLVVLALRWRRRNEDFFYSPLSDGILSMT